VNRLEWDVQVRRWISFFGVQKPLVCKEDKVFQLVHLIHLWFTPLSSFPVPTTLVRRWISWNTSPPLVYPYGVRQGGLGVRKVESCSTGSPFGGQGENKGVTTSFLGVHGLASTAGKVCTRQGVRVGIK
jgi:hypothetical protein